MATDAVKSNISEIKRYQSVTKEISDQLVRFRLCLRVISSASVGFASCDASFVCFQDHNGSVSPSADALLIWDVRNDRINIDGLFLGIFPTPPAEDTCQGGSD